MEKDLPMLPVEAFQDFLKNAAPKPLPPKIRTAKFDLGKPERGLGLSRIVSILTEYAPDRYDVVIEVRLKK